MWVTIVELSGVLATRLYESLQEELHGTPKELQEALEDPKEYLEEVSRTRVEDLLLFCFRGEEEGTRNPQQVPISEKACSYVLTTHLRISEGCRQWSLKDSRKAFHGDMIKYTFLLLRIYLLPPRGLFHDNSQITFDDQQGLFLANHNQIYGFRNIFLTVSKSFSSFTTTLTIHKGFPRGRSIRVLPGEEREGGRYLLFEGDPQQVSGKYLQQLPLSNHRFARSAYDGLRDGVPTGRALQEQEKIKG